MNYFGFAIADSMFSGDCMISRKEIHVTDIPSDICSCLNPSHTATIAVMKARFGIDVPIPNKPPVVLLQVGDSIIVMGVRGLPRLVDRHQYTSAEINGATFVFSIYSVLSTS